LIIEYQEIISQNFWSVFQIVFDLSLADFLSLYNDATRQEESTFFFIGVIGKLREMLAENKVRVTA